MEIQLTQLLPTGLVFGSGRVGKMKSFFKIILSNDSHKNVFVYTVCTGANNMLKCRLSVCEILNIVKECGYEKAQIRDFKIQNIVASFCYGMKLDLEMELHRELEMKLDVDLQLTMKKNM